MIEISPIGLDRFDEIWPIIEEVVRAGDSYALPIDLDRAGAVQLWSEPGRRVYVASIEGRTVGTYYLRTNQLGPGSHIANAGYMTCAAARGRGVARAMAMHSLAEASRLGYRGMQFNNVVATNSAAVHLWTSLGFATVGRIPGAFRLPSGEFVDALVMHRRLDRGTAAESS